MLFSIFDEAAFAFYIVKYAEIFGAHSLVACSSRDRTITYDQKVKMIDHIINTEQ